MRAVLVIVGAWLAAGPRPAEACKTPPPCAELVAGTDDPAKLVAGDGEVAARAALAFARSAKPEQLKVLGKALQTPAVLERIMKLDQSRRCVMPVILRALAANSVPQARKEFVALIASRAWAERTDRSDGSDLLDELLRATGVFRPVTPEVLALWTRLAKPMDGWVNVTVIALAENATPEAAALFERLLRDPKHDLDTKSSWLRSDLVGHRDQLELLKMAGRLLDAKLPAQLQAAVMEGVFDYRPEWYGTCPGPTLVPLARYTTDARAALRAVAAKARTHKPDPVVAAAITKAIAELDRIETKP